MMSPTGKQTIVIHILLSKCNRTRTFGQLKEYNMRNILLEKSYPKCSEEIIPRPTLKKLKLSTLLDL